MPIQHPTVNADNHRMIAAFDAHQRRRNLSPTTIAGRRTRLQGLARHLHARGKMLHEATTGDIEAWFDGLGQPHGLAPQTRHTYTRQLSAFYQWAISTGVVDHDPTAAIVRPRLPRPLPRPMDPADLRHALDQADDRKAAMLALAAYAGLRCQEIAGLRAEDIDWRNRRILVVHGKGAAERMVPMHDEVATRLRRMDVKHGFVFHRVWPRPSADPIRPGTVSQILSEHLHGLGIHASAHQGRHLFLTAVYEATQDLRLCQDLAGHASPVTTSRYAAWSVKRGLDAVGALAY